MGSAIEVKGLKEAYRAIVNSGRRGQEAAAGALYAEALHVIRISVKNTPVVTSRLRNSHFVTLPTRGRSPSLRVGYGAKYAYWVHEGIKTRKKLKDMPRKAQRWFWANASVSRGGGVSFPDAKVSTQGGPKFLANAINATSAGRFSRIAQTTKRYFEAGVGVKRDASTPASAAEGRAKAGQ